MKTAVNVLVGICLLVVGILAAVAIYLSRELARAKTEPARKASIVSRSKSSQNGQASSSDLEEPAATHPEVKPEQS